jgi:hypothetical protein
VAPRDGPHDEQPQARPFHPAGRGGRNSVEALKNAFQFGRRNSDPLIPDLQQDRVDVWSQDVHHDVFLIARIFDGIFDEIENGGS